MTSPHFQSYNVDPQSPSSLIELPPLKAGTKYSRIPSSHDEAAFGETPNAREDALGGLGGLREQSRSRVSKLGEALTKSDKWKYARISSLSAEPATSPNPFRGWRTAVIIAATVTAIVLLINTVFAVVCMAKYGARGGLGTLYTGDCDLVKRWDTALHLLINLLGTAVLAASSFTMQCLSSPTRSETDAAHARRRSLDVGIPSFKNLRQMDRRKGLLWGALLLSTLPLHLLWNSTFFSTLGANEFAYVVVDEDFLNGAAHHSFNYTACASEMGVALWPTLESIYDAYKAGNYSARMTPFECINAYSAPYVRGRRNMIAVTKPTTGMRMAPICGFGSSLGNVTAYDMNEITITSPEINLQPLWNGSSVLGFNYIDGNTSPSWLCIGWTPGAVGMVKCDRGLALSSLRSNGTWYLQPVDLTFSSSSPQQSYPIEYCYSEIDGQVTCQLQFASYILFVVIGCNLIKVGCMLWAAWLLWDLDEPIFATVGDAVTSYLDRPDETTKGWCLVDSAQVKAWRKAKPGDTPQQDRYCRPAKRKLFSATSKTRWWTTIGLCTLYLALGTFLLCLAVGAARGVYTLTQTWNLGIGAVNQDTTLGIGAKNGRDLLEQVLVANSFQLALSATYFLYNALYTAQCAALEWSTYTSAKRKPLRVTWPRGQQRSSYYLHLPYRYGLPLTVFLMLLHFFISQSIFLARVQYFDENGEIDVNDSFAYVGFSPIAILISVCIGAVLIMAQILHSFRPLDNHMPIHGNSSVVISAMCHPSNGTVGNEEGEEELSSRPVMWGAVVQPKDEDEVGHCSFTADVVEQPVRGRRYH